MKPLPFIFHNDMDKSNSKKDVQKKKILHN